MADVTVIGGGLAGMVAAIAAAEQGAKVYLYEAHQSLGGRARSTPPPFVANDGPHALYDNGALWPWPADRDLIARPARVPLGALAGFWFRWQGRLRHRPPAAVLRLLAKRDRHVPVDRDFHGWVAAAYGEQAATAAANLLGVATFDADPGRLSAAFAWERLLRVFGQLPAAARYPIGGWGAMVARMQARARQLGVVIQLGARVERLPDPPVIVVTSLEAARRLLGDDTLRWDSGRAVLLDVGLRRQRGDAFVISDLDEAGWAERFTAPDPTLAPPGHSLVQAQLPLRSGEGGPDGLRRLERLLELGYPGWRERLVWRRHGMANGRTGALDLPGRSWRDRPAVDRGEGVFLAGDMVAAPGLLSEVAFHSALGCQPRRPAPDQTSHPAPHDIPTQAPHRTVQDVITISPDAEVVGYGTTVRSFVHRTGLWRVVRQNPRAGESSVLFACAEGDRVALCGPWTIRGPRRPFRWTVSEINSGPFRWEFHILRGREARHLADKMQAKGIAGGN